MFTESELDILMALRDNGSSDIIKNCPSFILSSLAAKGAIINYPEKGWSITPHGNMSLSNSIAQKHAKRESDWNRRAFFLSTISVGIAIILAVASHYLRH